MYFEFKRRSALWLTFLVVAMAAVTTSLLLSKKGHMTGAEKPVARNEPFQEYQVQNNLSTDNVISGRSLADGSKLVKRAMVEPADDNMFYRYRCKGERLYPRLPMNDLELIHTYGTAQVHTTREDMYENGWTLDREEYYPIESADASILSIAGLTGIEECPQLAPLQLQNFDFGSGAVGNKWAKARSGQDKPYSRPDLGDQTQRPPTGAIYETLTSFSQRGTVITSAYSPKHMSGLSNLGQPLPEDQLPKVQKLSEGMFVHWGDRLRYNLNPPSGSQKDDPPRWVLINQVHGPPDTLSIISRCLRRYGWALQQLPGWNNRFRFTPSTLGSVTVYGSGATNAQGQETPSLLWYIDKERTLRDLRTANEAYQADNRNDNDITKVTHRLRPRPIDPNGDDCWTGGICG
ncbi:hypothetical protein PRZ48_008147 [Zasmidium cellare]|uniref:Uncharacterized protein n=1 Tax=Zasmidium cellare TaxID=395010 RepID=A0ABR0EFB8_ZASCE|nr:hypothetical protein PRZ48_008147 [Zasmidium cellare]